MTGHPESQSTTALVTVLGGARWGRLRRLGGNGLVRLDVFDWGVQIGPAAGSFLARFFPPTRLEWPDIKSMERRRRWGIRSLRFERSEGVPITFVGEIESAVGILHAHGLAEA